MLGKIAASALETPGVAGETTSLIDLNGDVRRFMAEGFFNQYSVFIFVAPRHRAKLGRHTRVVVADDAASS